MTDDLPDIWEMMAASVAAHIAIVDGEPETED